MIHILDEIRELPPKRCSLPGRYSRFEERDSGLLAPNWPPMAANKLALPPFTVTKVAVSDTAIKPPKLLVTA